VLLIGEIKLLGSIESHFGIDLSPFYGITTILLFLIFYPDKKSRNTMHSWALIPSATMMGFFSIMPFFFELYPPLKAWAEASVILGWIIIIMYCSFFVLFFIGKK
jgi:hypothetical protein